jgi:hypothetical protein
MVLVNTDSLKSVDKIELLTKLRAWVLCRPYAHRYLVFILYLVYAIMSILFIREKESKSVKVRWLHYSWTDL